MGINISSENLSYRKTRNNTTITSCKQHKQHHSQSALTSHSTKTSLPTHLSSSASSKESRTQSPWNRFKRNSRWLKRERRKLSPAKFLRSRKSLSRLSKPRSASHPWSVLRVRKQLQAWARSLRPPKLTGQ